MLTTLAAAVFMEPVTALTHRVVMHRRPGWSWHRSHHAGRGGGLEANDRFPLVFAAATVGAMAVGSTRARSVGAGVTLYGVAYALVHDVCIHGRLTGGRPVGRSRWLRYLADAHAVHHRTGAAPYGFLAPIVPMRERAATQTFSDPGTRTRPVHTS
jgi:beta-carotene 3-hydroxylase